MTCKACGKESDVVFRANVLGETPAIWYCESCMTKPIDPEVKELTDILRTKK